MPCLCWRCSSLTEIFLGPKFWEIPRALSAFWVLVAIIVGGGLFGFVGMVVGVPAFAVLYSLTSDILARRLAEKGIDAQGNPVQKARCAARPKARLRRSGGRAIKPKYRVRAAGSLPRKGGNFKGI